MKNSRLNVLTVLASGLLCGGLWTAAAGDASVSAQVGQSVEFRLPSAGGSATIVSDLAQLPAGLRVKDGVVVGTPVSAGDFTAQVTAGGATYNVAFHVSAGNNAGSRAADSLALTSRATATPAPAAPGQSVVFTVAACGSGALTYAWDFGDGSSGSGASVSHSYSAPGIYIARVVISNGAAATGDHVSMVVQGDAIARVRAASGNAALRASKSTSFTFQPFSFLTITGSGFDPTAKTIVRFTLSKTAFLDVKAFSVKADAIEVVVPPAPKGAGFKSANAKVQLFVGSNPTPVDVAGKIKIADLPKTKTTPGMATISYLNMNKQMLVAVQPRVAGTNLFPTSSQTNITNSITRIDDLMGTIDGATRQSVKGTDGKVFKNSLINSDRIVLGMLSAGAAVTDDAAFASASSSWMNALQTEASTTTAEKGYGNVFLANLGLDQAGVAVKSIGPREVTISGGIKFTTGLLGGIAALSHFGGAALTAAGAAGAGAALAAVAVPLGTATLIIGVTATLAIGVSAGVATVADKITGKGSGLGPKLAGEAAEVAKSIVTDKIKEGLGGAAGGLLGEQTGKLAENAVGLYNSGSDVATNLPQQQSGGSFTASLIRTGNTYYVTVTSMTANLITVAVSGSDGYAATFSGTGSVTTSTIPAGATGVTDTITVRDTVTSEQRVFAFTF